MEKSLQKFDKGHFTGLKILCLYQKLNKILNYISLIYLKMPQYIEGLLQLAQEDELHECSNREDTR